MKKNIVRIAVIFLIFLISGCGTVMNNPPQFLGNNRYQVNVSGFAGLTVSSAITRDWNKAASGVCQGRPYEIITRSFSGKDQNGMQGVIECK